MLPVARVLVMAERMLLPNASPSEAVNDSAGRTEAARARRVARNFMLAFSVEEKQEWIRNVSRKEVSGTRGGKGVRFENVGDWRKRTPRQAS